MSGNLLARLHDLARVEVDALTAGAGAETAHELIMALSEDLCDALAEARDQCAALDRVPAAGLRPIDLDPLALAEQSADARRAVTDEDVMRLGAALTAHAERRRRAAALEDAAAPLLAKLRDVDRRLL